MTMADFSPKPKISQLSKWNQKSLLCWVLYPFVICINMHSNGMFLNKIYVCLCVYSCLVFPWSRENIFLYASLQFIYNVKKNCSLHFVFYEQKWITMSSFSQNNPVYLSQFHELSFKNGSSILSTVRHVNLNNHTTYNTIV